MVRTFYTSILIRFYRDLLKVQLSIKNEKNDLVDLGTEFVHAF